MDDVVDHLVWYALAHDVPEHADECACCRIRLLATITCMERKEREKMANLP